MYVTQCPKCGGDLYVISFTASTSIRVHRDGYSTLYAKFMDTEDERVSCNNCRYVGRLKHVHEDESRRKSGRAKK